MFIACHDPSVRATGRWGMWDQILTATAAGSKLEIAFCGPGCILHFDLNHSHHPLPHLWLQLDGGARFEVPLDRFLRVECEEGAHLLTVILKGEVEMHHRWHLPLDDKLALIGYEAEAPGVLPENHRPTVELIGDSITEGVLVDAMYAPDKNDDQLNRPYQDDACATYAYLTAQALGWEPLCGGYGAVGATHGGCGGVPAAAEMYPYCFEGVPVSYPEPDYILINHGTNDGLGDWVKDYPAAFTRLLTVICEKRPHAKLIVLTPFCGWLHDELTALVEDFSRTQGREIFLVDTTGWLPAEPLHPLREGHRLAAQKLTAAIRAHFGL